MKGFGKYIIVKPVDSTRQLSSGLLVPEGNDKDVRHRKGVVVHAPEKMLIANQIVDIDLPEGSVILYDIAGGFSVYEGEQQFKIVMIDYVVAIL